MNNISSLVPLFLVIIFCYGCSINNPVSDFVDNNSYYFLTKVENFDRYYGGAVGYAGSEPKEWKVFQKYRKTLSENEVEYIVNNYSGIVKMYTYQAGVINGYRITDTLLNIHKNDETIVSTFVGCLMMPQTVGDFIISIRTYPPINSGLSPLSSMETDEINKGLILSGNRLSHRRSYLLITYDKKLREGEIEILRNQFDDGDFKTIIQIAKSNNKDDLSRIDSVLKTDSTKYFGMLAVSYYPDELFRESILDEYEKVLKMNGGYDYSMIRSLYHAYVNYLNDEQMIRAIDRINEINDDFKRNMHKENMFQSVMMSNIYLKDKIIKMLDFKDDFGDTQGYIDRNLRI